MILGLGGHVGIWAAQALSLGAAFPPLHPCWNAGKLVMFSRESDVWIFRTIYLFFFFQSTDFNDNLIQKLHQRNTQNNI